MKRLLSLLLCVFLLTAVLTSCVVVKPDKTLDSKEDTEQTDISTSTTGTVHDNGPKVKYQVYTNADQTYRLVIRDHRNKAVFEADKLIHQPIPTTIDEEKGIYELGWATGTGATEYECVYYNAKTGQVSQQFRAPFGTDGLRIAYCSDDQTKVIVQPLFDGEDAKKEHVLENAYNRNGTIIVSGKLQEDQKTILIAYYVNAEGETARASVPLYE